MAYRALVTGGAGFIGSNLVDALISKGYIVSIVDNLSTGFSKNLNKKAKFYKLSVTEKNEIGDLLNREKYDYIFHLAAEPAVGSTLEKSIREFKTTITGINNLLPIANRNNLKKFIYFSSAATYNQDAKLPIKETEYLNPISFYGLSKLIGELTVKCLATIKEIDYVIFRPANVYGPRQRIDGEGGVIATFIGNLLKEQNITIFGNGKKIRDFIHVSDITKASILAIENNLSGIYNLGTAKQTSIAELAKYIQVVANKKTKIEFSDNRSGEIQNSSLDFQKINQFGWMPQTSLPKGLKNTWDYFIKL